MVFAVLTETSPALKTLISMYVLWFTIESCRLDSPLTADLGYVPEVCVYAGAIFHTSLPPRPLALPLHTATCARVNVCVAYVNKTDNYHMGHLDAFPPKYQPATCVSRVRTCVGSGHNGYVG